MDEATSGGRRVAFFGGTFDPPHLGHLAVARAARAALGLDAVLFAPVGAQPLKPHGSAAGFEDRLAMTRLAVAGEPDFAVSLVDAPKPAGAPNFTLDSLLRLRAELPPDGVLFCLMGADAFLGLRRWRGSAEIPFAAPLIVASRPGQRVDDLKAALPEGVFIESAPDAARAGSAVEVRSFLLRNSAGESAPFYILPGLNVEISASDIREQMRAASGARTKGHELLPKAVSDYIRAHNLYR
jgi:nicotinate-nucleotide adenylyltransferase